MLASTICLRSSSICVLIASSSVSVWVVSCVRSRSGILIRRSLDVKVRLKVMTSEGSRDYVYRVYMCVVCIGYIVSI